MAPMCSRYSLTTVPQEVGEIFGTWNRPNFPPRYNIAPTQPVLIVRPNHKGERELVLVRWGLIPGWVKDPDSFSTLINARAESALDKPSFRAGLRHRRCLIPADGFYEWAGPKGRKRPHFLRRRDNAPFAFAGLWEHWQGADGSEIETAVILTTAANGLIAPLHERMPAVLPPERFADWLDIRNVPAETAVTFLKPAPDDFLISEEVSPKVNDARNDASDIRLPAQGELF